METDRYQIIEHSDYPTMPIVNKVLTATFCYCSYAWAVQIIIAVFPLYICCWFRVVSSLSGGRGTVNLLSYHSDTEGPGDCGSGVFRADEADGVGDKGTGINTSVDAETVLVAFM